MYVQAAPPAAAPAAPGRSGGAGSSSGPSAGAAHRTSAGQPAYKGSTTGRHSQR